MTFKLFLQLVDHRFNSATYKAQLRYGQYVMNELYNVWPEKYAQVVGTNYNCFYDDTLVKAALFKLEKEWVNNVSRT